VEAQFQRPADGMHGVFRIVFESAAADWKTA
jgi:hypothetical protein